MGASLKAATAGTAPDEISFATAMSCCARAGRLGATFRLFEAAERAGFVGGSASGGSAGGAGGGSFIASVASGGAIGPPRPLPAPDFGGAGVAGGDASGLHHLFWPLLQVCRVVGDVGRAQRVKAAMLHAGIEVSGVSAIRA